MSIFDGVHPMCRCKPLPFDAWATYLSVVRRAEEVGRRRRAHRRTVRRQRRAKRGWR